MQKGIKIEAPHGFVVIEILDSLQGKIPNLLISPFEWKFAVCDQESLTNIR
jgi:hypothetical protein